jgi:hypothetical protein
MGFNGLNAQKKKGSPPTSDKEVAMKRFLALLALVLALMAGTAGMASALTLGFDSPPSTPPYPEIAAITNLNWDSIGFYEGHLWCTNPTMDNTISFTNSTYVNNFQMTGVQTELLWEQDCKFGPMNIAAFNATDVQLWTTTVEFDENHRMVADPDAWLTVTVNTADVSKIIFYASNNPYDPDGYFFYPSIDNLVINEAAGVPISASVWLLASGLLALVGLRRKFTH